MYVCLPQGDERGKFLKEGNMKGRKKLSAQGRQRSFRSPESGVSKPVCAEAVLSRVTGVVDPGILFWKQLLPPAYAALIGQLPRWSGRSLPLGPVDWSRGEHLTKLGKWASSRSCLGGKPKRAFKL